MACIINDITRRRFVKCAVAATASGVARAMSAAQGESITFIDTHVYLGHWPLGRLNVATPGQLVAQLRRDNVSQAWAGSVDGLFHKDIHGVNARLIEACRNTDEGFLIPVGSINPTLPDWEEDLRRCHEDFKMPGIRLHPAYHGYALDDSRLARLLELASERQLFVQIVTKLTAPKHRLLTPAPQSAATAPLTRIARSSPALRVIICGDAPKRPAVVTEDFRESTNLFFSLDSIAGNSDLARLENTIGANRLVYGTAAPLNANWRTLHEQMRNLFSANQMRAVSAGNAQSLTSP